MKLGFDFEGIKSRQFFPLYLYKKQKKTKQQRF